MNGRSYRINDLAYRVDDLEEDRQEPGADDHPGTAPGPALDEAVEIANRRGNVENVATVGQGPSILLLSKTSGSGL